jgi:nicotinate-nucleotide adenylyltransferase
MRKIGVLGGTFDPVHNGHLAIADEALKEGGLSEVIFMPAGKPYFKLLTAISPGEDRMQMLKLAIAGQAKYSLSLMELEREGPSYAVDSIASIKERVPARDQVFFILGWDALVNLPLWHQAKRLIKICRIIAAPRPGYARPDLSQIEKKLPGLSGRCILMEKPLNDISSTNIRAKAAAGLPIDEWVPAGVGKYIREKGLYIQNNLCENQQSNSE